MPRARQIACLVLLSLGLWVAATLYIKLLPAAFTDPLMGSIGFVTTLPVAWLSIWLVRRAASLAADQLLAGVAIVGALAMMIDGLALRFFSAAYGTDERTLRLGAAWLLWGYGVSLAIALLWSSRTNLAREPS